MGEIRGQRGILDTEIIRCWVRDTKACQRETEQSEVTMLTGLCISYPTSYNFGI